MNLRAVLAALVLIGVSGAPPDLSSTVKVAEVSQRAFSSPGMYFATLDDGSTVAQQLFAHDPTEAPDATGEVRHYRVAGVDYFVVATLDA